jgi:hypothetical protein
MTNFFKGAATGFLSMFGLGDLYNELGKASSELKGIQDKMNSLTQISSLKASENTVSEINKLLELNNITQIQQSNMKDQTNQFINDSLQKENLFILFCYILLFILIVFFLIQKKCC